MIGANQGLATISDRVEYSTRKFFEKYSVYIRKVTVTQKRHHQKIVGFTSKTDADAKATELSQSSNVEAAVAVRGAATFWEVQYVVVTETRNEGSWYIPVTPA